MLSYQYSYSHCKDKMISQLSYFYNENTLPGKTVLILKQWPGGARNKGSSSNWNHLFFPEYSGLSTRKVKHGSPCHTCLQGLITTTWSCWCSGTKPSAVTVSADQMTPFKLAGRYHGTLRINSFTPGRWGYDPKLVILKLISRMDILNLSCRITSCECHKT